MNHNLTQENKLAIRKWVVAMRSGMYIQSRGHLANGDSRCAIGVAVEANGVSLKSLDIKRAASAAADAASAAADAAYAEYAAHAAHAASAAAYAAYAADAAAYAEYKDTIGTYCSAASGVYEKFRLLTGLKSTSEIVNYNDRMGKDLNEIADIVEKEYLSDSKDGRLTPSVSRPVDTSEKVAVS